MFSKGRTAIDFSSCTEGLTNFGINKKPRTTNTNVIIDPVMIVLIIPFFLTNKGLITLFETVSGLFSAFPIAVIISLIALATLLI